jgi:adenylate cyclase
VAGAPVPAAGHVPRRYSHGWSDRPQFAQIDVRPLERRLSEEFLESLLAPMPRWRRSSRPWRAGPRAIPFFIEESVRSLVETGAIVGGETWRIDKPLTELEIAPSVQAVLSARMDRLPAEDKRLLQPPR